MKSQGQKGQVTHRCTAMKWAKPKSPHFKAIFWPLLAVASQENTLLKASTTGKILQVKN